MCYRAAQNAVFNPWTEMYPEIKTVIYIEANLFQSVPKMTANDINDTRTDLVQVGDKSLLVNESE